MSRARSVSQLVGANTALGNTVITGTANVSSTLAAGNTTIMGTGYIQVTNATSYTTSTRVGSGLTVYNSSNTNSYAGIELISEPTAGNGGICGIAGLSTGSGDSALVFGTRGSSTYAERMRIDASGRVTMPYQPAFMAVVPTEKTLTGGADNALTDHFTSTTYNVGGHYNTSNGRFTAPVAGLYHFVADLYVYTCSTCEIYFKINGSTYIRTWDKGQGLNTNPSGNHRSYQVSLSVGDYITLAAVPNQTAALWNGGPYSSRFTGCLIR